MKDWRDKDFWMEFIAGIIRKLLGVVALWLSQQGYASAESAKGLTAQALAYFLAGGVLAITSIAWQYAKNKYNALMKRAASDSDPETPLSIVKNDVLNEHKFISPV